MDAERLLDAEEKPLLPKLSYPEIDYPGRKTPLFPPKEPKKCSPDSNGPTALLFILSALCLVLMFWLFSNVNLAAGLVIGGTPMIVLLIMAFSSASRGTRSRAAVEQEYRRDLQRYEEEKKQYEKDRAAQVEGVKKQRAANAEIDAENREIAKQNAEIEQFNKTLRLEKEQNAFRILQTARKVLYEELMKLGDVLEQNYRDFLPEKCRDKESVDGLLDIFDYGRAETLPEALRLLYDDRMKQQAQTT